MPTRNPSCIFPPQGMVKRCRLWLLGSALVCFCGPAAAQPGDPLVKREWDSERDRADKLGLSMKEWQQIQESGMSMETVERILGAGVTMTEFFSEPWKELHLSREEWLANRRRGLTNDDMRYNSSAGPSQEQWAVVHNFFLPGFHQLKRKQYLKGGAMAVGALSFAGYGTFALIAEMKGKGFYGYPFFLFVLLPLDMAWSSIDIHLQIQKESNSALRRFSGGSTSLRIGCGFPLR